MRLQDTHKTIIATTKPDEAGRNSARTEFEKWCDEHYFLSSERSPWLFDVWYRQYRLFTALYHFNGLKYTDLKYEHRWFMICGIKDIADDFHRMPSQMFRTISDAIDWITPSLSNVCDFCAYLDAGIIYIEVDCYDGKKDLYTLRPMSHEGIAACKDEPHQDIQKELQPNWFKEIQEYEIY